MPKHYITSHLPLWSLQAPVCAIVKGSGVTVGINERSFFTKRKYWPGRCHR